MQTLSAPFLATIGASVTQPLVLVEIGFAAPLRLNSREELTWDGKLWLADRVCTVQRRAEGATLTLGNHDDLLGAYLLNERVADRAINIWEAWLDGASMHVRQVLAGIGGQARCGVDVAVIEAVAGNALAHAPRLLIRHAVGWPPPKPEGFRFAWDGQDYTLGARQ